MDFSVDMIRLSIRVSGKRFLSFMNSYKYLDADFWIGKKQSDYHYNWTVRETLCSKLDMKQSYWIGFWHGSESNQSNSDDALHSLVVEFNPNKCLFDTPDIFLHLLLREFFNDITKIRLHSCDLCCDFPDIDYKYFYVDRGRKRYVCEIDSGQGRTLYVGKRGSSGRIKVYDKAAELGLKDKVLTRYEISLSFDSTYFLNILFTHSFLDSLSMPTVYIDIGQLSIITDSKLKACVYAVKSGYMSINEFSHEFKQKIRQYLVDTVELKIDTSCKTYFCDTIITFVRNFCNTFRLLDK